MYIQQKAFADRLKMRRRELGYAQLKMAEKLGISIRTYQRWEAGEVLPHWRNLDTLEDIGISTEGILIANLDSRLARLEEKVDLILTALDDLNKA